MELNLDQTEKATLIFGDAIVTTNVADHVTYPKTAPGMISYLGKKTGWSEDLQQGRLGRNVNLHEKSQHWNKSKSGEAAT